MDCDNRFEHCFVPVRACAIVAWVAANMVFVELGSILLCAFGLVCVARAQLLVVAFLVGCYVRPCLSWHLALLKASVLRMDYEPACALAALVVLYVCLEPSQIGVPLHMPCSVCAES